jgi:hypothetical protein
MDWGTLLAGAAIGLVVGALIFTPTGREVSGTVARAGAGVVSSTGQRLQREISK